MSKKISNKVGILCCTSLLLNGLSHNSHEFRELCPDCTAGLQLNHLYIPVVRWLNRHRFQRYTDY